MKIVQVGELIGQALSPANSIGFEVTFSFSVQGRDTHFFITINNDTQNGHYQSYVVADGHYSAGEWDQRSFYIGRNGWHLDAEVSVTYRITFNTGGKQVGSGQSTFIHGNNNIIGYVCHGCRSVDDKEISSITLSQAGPATISNFQTSYRWLTR